MAVNTLSPLDVPALETWETQSIENKKALFAYLGVDWKDTYSTAIPNEVVTQITSKLRTAHERNAATPIIPWGDNTTVTMHANTYAKVLSKIQQQTPPGPRVGGVRWAINRWTGLGGVRLGNSAEYKRLQAALNEMVAAQRAEALQARDATDIAVRARKKVLETLKMQISAHVKQVISDAKLSAKEGEEAQKITIADESARRLQESAASKRDQVAVQDEIDDAIHNARIIAEKAEVERLRLSIEDQAQSTIETLNLKYERSAQREEQARKSALQRAELREDLKDAVQHVKNSVHSGLLKVIPFLYMHTKKIFTRNS